MAPIGHQQRTICNCREADVTDRKLPHLIQPYHRMARYDHGLCDRFGIRLLDDRINKVVFNDEGAGEVPHHQPDCYAAHCITIDRETGKRLNLSL